MKNRGENLRYRLFLLVIVLLFWLWSVINVQDTYLTWFLETVPVMIVLPILLLTYQRFPLTNLTYTIIAIHAMILMYGGHYSYAKAPLGFWMEQWFGWTRNNYDKIGHFTQGFIPAIWGREILIRLKVVKNSGWLNFLLVASILGFSAFYEFVEWWVSLLSGEAGDAFLGTQGYIWDTQSDMLYCFIGAILALLLLSKIHDRAIKSIRS